MQALAALCCSISGRFFKCRNTQVYFLSNRLRGITTLLLDYKYDFQAGICTACVLHLLSWVVYKQCLADSCCISDIQKKHETAGKDGMGYPGGSPSAVHRRPPCHPMVNLRNTQADTPEETQEGQPREPPQGVPQRVPRVTQGVSQSVSRSIIKFIRASPSVP